MSEMQVRIIRLEPMKIASSYGFGPGPEGIAWEKMSSFVSENGFSKDGQEHRYFGFNNPSPTPGSPNYGYEQWVTIGPEAQPTGDIKIKTFDGGLYAVTHCTLDDITTTWHALFNWREKSQYRPANHQWLEECLTPPVEGKEITGAVEFDIYLPIAG